MPEASGTPGQQAAGAHADAPNEIPPRGWWQVARRGWRKASEHQVPLLAAGVAFFGFLALFPALIAFTLIYGLFADPAQITEQAGPLLASLPPDASSLVTDQLQQLASAPREALGWGLALSIVVALWSASGGVGNLQHLVDGITIARADAVLAASIFHFGEYTVGDAKAALAAAGVDVRPVRD